MKMRNGISSSAKMYLKIFPVIYKCEPVYMTIMFLESILASAILGIMTIVSAQLFDSVSKSIKDKELAPVIIIASVFAVVIIGNQVLDGVSNFMYMNFLLKVQGKLRQKIHKSASEAEPILFEDAKYLDAINKADQGIDGACGLIGSLNEIFVYQLPYLIVMGIYLFSIKPVLVISLVLIFIPAFIVQFLKCSVYSKLEDKLAPLRRELDYYQSAICAKENFKETRLLGAYHFFEKKLLECLCKYNNIDWNLKFRASLMEIGSNIISIIGYGVVIILLISLLIRNEITIGEFSAIFASVATMFSKLQEVSNRLMGFSQYMPLAKNFYDFINLPKLRFNKGEYISNSGIVIKNVNFSYPGSDKLVLQNINLSIKPHEKIAIVGENGAGKSTLAKLLIGLYMPDSGNVILGGLDTTNISGENLYKHTTALFQNFQKYKFSVKCNVEISDFNSTNNYNETLDIADINIDDVTIFPDEGDTILSKEFGGIDLSGGLWQRVAIARAIYKNSDLIVLDEPTSAIDPLEETKLYNKLIEISKNRTSVMVTHRLGLARYMDRIIVVDNGKIIEEGNHESLLRSSGKYNDMWKLQSDVYKC